jgi:aconitate decarboxylase
VSFDTARGALTDPATHALAARIRTAEDGSTDPNALAPQTGDVRLRDGRTFHWSCETLLASPVRRPTRERHLAKFRRCVEFAADPLATSATEALIERIDVLDDVADVRELTDLVRSR